MNPDWKHRRARGAHFLAGLATLLLAACATPEARIRKNPDLFASFPSEAQELIRQGEVAVGFTRDMVQIALGSPDRIYTRQTAEGTTEIWSYVSHEVRADRQLVDGRFRVYLPGAGYRTVTDTVWVDVNSRYEYDRLRIEFRDGQVYAVERLER